MSLPRPQFHGLLRSSTKKHMAGMAISSLLAVILLKYLYVEPRKEKLSNYFKNIDPEKQLQAMNEAGLMQSYVED